MSIDTLPDNPRYCFCPQCRYRHCGHDADIWDMPCVRPNSLILHQSLRGLSA